MADIKNIDVFQTVTSVSFEVEPNTDIININKVTTSGYSGVPNLQEVTDIGANTDNPITITIPNPTAVPFYTNNFSSGFGDFVQSQNNDTNWSIVSNEAKSGIIPHNGKSGISLTKSCPTDVTILQYTYRTSTEQDYDYLFVILDGAIIKSYSGNISTTTDSITIQTAGNHTIQFVYSKDNSDVFGDDTVWIDNVSLISGENALTVNKSVYFKDSLYLNNVNVVGSVSAKTIYANLLDTRDENGDRKTTYSSAGIRFYNPTQNLLLGGFSMDPTTTILSVKEPNGVEIFSAVAGGTTRFIQMPNPNNPVHIGQYSDVLPTGYMLNVAGTSLFKDAVTATSFIKSGGSPNEILAADGSIITAGTNITISGGTISSTGGGGGGATNLTTSQTASNFTINSDTGTDAIVPLGNGTLAGASLNDYTTAEKNKLSGIATGAEVNVNADWNAVSGDAQILNKPTIPSITNLVPYTGATTDVDLGLNDITAAKLIKDGGTSSQFLKANGSVDNNTYLTSADLPSTLDLYATTTASDISGYTVLVRSITDTRYDDPAENVPTPTITGTLASPTFCGALISDPSILLGDPGVFNFSVIGKIRRTGGATASGADFFYSIYKRDISGVETLIANSAPVAVPANGGIYIEYISIALWNNGIFLSTDRVVLKFYGIQSGTGSGATYEFLFGGADPVRGTAAISSAIIPNLYLRDLADVEKIDALNNEVLYWNDADSLWEHSLAEDLVPNATATQKGLVSTTVQTFAGAKTFTGAITASNLSGTNTGDNATNTQYSGLATSKQDVITLTTTGTSGASTLVGATLNIPQYSGATNLGYTAAPTNGTVTSSTGTSATLPLADATNAGLLKPAKFTVLENTSGTNTGDQDLSGYALLASPTFTGTPSLPTGTIGVTQTAGDNSTKIATTAFVSTAVAAGGVTVSGQDTFGTANIATVTAAQYAAFVTAGTVSATTLYFITA